MMVILAPSLSLHATIHYVNDTYTGSDIWCTATGNDGTGNGSATAPYATVAAALSGLSSGDTIRIDDGSYSETGINLNSASYANLLIQGAGASSTIFDGGGANARFLKISNSSADNVIIRDLQVKNYNGTSTGESGTGYGSGIFILNGVTGVQIINCNFNSFSNNNGAIFLTGTASATIKSTTMYGNTARAITCASDGTTGEWSGSIKLDNSTFTQNVSSSNGAVLYVVQGSGTGGSIIIDSCTIGSYSVAADSNGVSSSSGEGGAIYDWGINITMSHSTFAHNSSGAKGGAVYTFGSNQITIDTCTFHENSAPNGGGAVYGADNYYSGPDKIEITASTLDNNTVGTSYDGGAIYFDPDPFGSMTMTLTKCIFHDNKAGNTNGYGGAIWANILSSFTVTNSLFYKNYAYKDGSAVYLSSPSSVSIHSSTFADDSLSTTSSRYCLSSDLGDVNGTIKNTIFYGNTSQNDIGLTQGVFGNVTVSYSLFNNIASSSINGAGNISSDPQFVNTGSDNYHLQSTSPAIDAGTSSGAPSDDLDGTIRPLGSGYDMGCYESTSNGPTNPVAQDLPYSQDFGTTTFSSMPSGMAAWTVISSPKSSQSSAESSVNNANATVHTATAPQTTGDVYGYATSSNGRVYIQTSGNATNGTNQIALAVKTLGTANITVAYTVEMISANSRTIGAELQYRTDTTSSWTTVSGTAYSHSSADRSNGDIDRFTNIILPKNAENDSLVELRWITWRSGSGSSSGIGIDSIRVTGHSLSDFYFRSAKNGIWADTASWQFSTDSSSWSAATLAPDYHAKSIVIQSGDTISLTSSDTIDQTVVNGTLIYADSSGSVITINDGTGTDLTINGTYEELGGSSEVWIGSANWVMGANGTLIRTRSTSSNNWRDKYESGISNIPATANWIVRKVGTDNPTLSTIGGMYYPNLIVENISGSAWVTSVGSSFSGSSDYPRIKGNFDIGGNGSAPVTFMDTCTNTTPTEVDGNLTVRTGSALHLAGTGISVKKDVSFDGTLDYGTSNTRKVVFNGSSNQNLSGTSANVNMYNLTIDDSAATDTVFFHKQILLADTLVINQGFLNCLSYYFLEGSHPFIKVTPSISSYICPGDSVKLATSGGYTSYLWTPTSNLNPSTGDTVYAKPDTTTAYLVTGSDSSEYGCVSGFDTVHVYPGISISISLDSSIYCHGDSTGVVTAHVTGNLSPYTYLWKPYGGTDSTADSLVGGTYTVVVTDSLGCKDSATVTLTQPDSIHIFITADSIITSDSGGVATAHVTGGTAPYTYLWSPYGGTDSTADSLVVGTYTVLVSDSLGCNDSAIVVISSPDSLYYRSDTTKGIWADTASWQYSVDSITWAPAKFIPDYHVKSILIQKGDTINITNNDTIDQTVVNGTLVYTDSSGSMVTFHNGAGVDLTVNGTYEEMGSSSEAWMDTATWAMGDSATLLRTEVTSSNNWRDHYQDSISHIPATANWIIRNNGSGEPSLSTTGGMYYPNLIIENTSGATWHMTGGSIFQGYSDYPRIKGNLDIGGTGTDSIVFVDSCTNATPVPVDGNLIVRSGSALRIAGTGMSVQKDVTMDGAMDYGATNDRKFVFNGNTNQTFDGTDTNGVVRIYDLTIDQGSSSDTVSFRRPIREVHIIHVVQGHLTCKLYYFLYGSTPVPVSPNNSTVCGGGSITLTASGYDTYSWSPAGSLNTTTGASVIASPTATTTYTVVGSNASETGCISGTATVAISSGIPVNVVSKTDPLCSGDNNGSIIVQATGGNRPYTYAWSPSVGTDSIVSGLVAGTYSVTVTSNGGCSGHTNTTIYNPKSITLHTSVTNACGSGTGSATVDASGGTAPYTYLWRPSGSTSNTATGLSDGNDTVLVTDAHGCTSTAIVTVHVYSAPTVSVSPASATIDAGENTTLTATGSGGTAPYTYSWTPSAGLSATTGATVSAGPSATTTYTVTVKDANGLCTGTSTVTVTVNVPYVAAPTTCDTCLGGLNLIPGKTYLVDVWAKDSSASPVDTTYLNPAVKIVFPSTGDSIGPVLPSGRIIDGWQRIEVKFTVPVAATDFNIKLTCASGTCNFDDIRVFPFNGTLKTYVYDPMTLRLLAVLDERNYATIYEYDQEGKLIRVKKETERGIMTIKESRTSMHK